MAADLLPYATGTNSMAWAGFSEVARTLIAQETMDGFREALGAQAALGYVPVRQGGGAGQQDNTVRLGWDGLGALKAQVDATDLGRVWTDHLGPLSMAGGIAHQRLPSGLIVQGGSSVATTNSSGGGTINFQIAYPASCIVVVACSGDPGAYSGPVIVAAFGASGFDFRRVDGVGGATRVNWIALGL